MSVRADGAGKADAAIAIGSAGAADVPGTSTGG